MPMSKGRKKKSKRRDKRPSAAQAYSAVIREFEGVAADDPLLAEMLASDHLSAGAQVDEEMRPDDTAFLKVVDFAGRRTSRGALTMLRALQTIGMTPDVRQAAMEAAEKVAAAGVPEPAWLDRIDRVEGGRCWTISDAYGDTVTVIAEFARDGQRHAIHALVDTTLLNGALEGIGIVDYVDELATEFQHEVDADPLSAMAEVPLASGLEIVRSAMPMAMIEQDEEEEDDERPAAAYAPLLYARCRAIGMADARPVEPEPLNEVTIGDIVDTFMESEPELTDPAAARLIVQLLAEYGWMSDAQRPTRPSPAKFAAYLLDHLPRVYALPERYRAAVPEAMRAWTAWTAAKLPAAALDALAEDLDELLDEFAADYPKAAGDAAIIVTDDGQFIAAPGLELS
ncbi:hypothetical protein [Fodinicola acaciae]|uniref:hypothetical protein n=1 Tax=Fodinicola acaciae TaxID=2681555 RepID=UPI0013D36C24|nr:hypothetical protein [Fodinicola acaciae]